MARAKRIYEIAKELVRDEKEIMEFLTAQGIRVANRLSAVNEDTYNLVKTKFTEQPKVEEPEPPKVEEPAPKVEQPKAEQNDAAPSPKKKKKNKAQQPPDGTQPPTIQMQPQQNLSDLNAATQAVYNEAIKAGNEFIGHYKQVNEKKTDIAGNGMGVAFDSFGLLFSGKVYNADESPALYWRAVNKLTTAAYRKIQRFGLKHKEELAEMREAMKEVGSPYVPR
ncbi:MAG: translation initiation factor IF-2 N-terminal domain-containing protein, partial [Selenomonadaceae bacterium]|nr:translation initiation factor IF-2 N-terminal domain-containing protein [Selenomonadaceae bacterium]